MGCSAFRDHPGIEAINASRSSFTSPLSWSGLRSTPTVLSVQSSIRPLRSMSIFVPGFAITRTAMRKARMPYRADPFSDEDLDAGAGSRYDCFLCSIHQLASARCRPTATAALPWFLAARKRSYNWTT